MKDKKMIIAAVAGVLLLKSRVNGVTDKGGGRMGKISLDWCWQLCYNEGRLREWL